jgi:hypothetical protein
MTRIFLKTQSENEKKATTSALNDSILHLDFDFRNSEIAVHAKNNSCLFGEEFGGAVKTK